MTCKEKKKVKLLENKSLLRKAYFMLELLYFTICSCIDRVIILGQSVIYLKGALPLAFIDFRISYKSKEGLEGKVSRSKVLFKVLLDSDYVSTK